jgi:exo-beta-1,3-glucanase (GH17 family)
MFATASPPEICGVRHNKPFRGNMKAASSGRKKQSHKNSEWGKKVQTTFGILGAIIAIPIGIVTIISWIDPGWLCCTAGLWCEKPQHIHPPEMHSSICWVAYSPTHYDPESGLKPNEIDVRNDLKELRKVGFSGLVTYTAKGVLGEKLPKIAEEEGFVNLIIGIWDPLDADELRQAEAASQANITKGFVVGNEGLYPKDGHPPRYTICQLRERMNALRRKTGKPVTTSEDSAAYSKDKELTRLGDWLFPNAHPYWAGYSDPRQAAEWTRNFFREQSHGNEIPVVLKEVGLPTVAGGKGQASEKAQAEYYKQLGDHTGGADRRVDFVYFEAFDQPWKKGTGERSWGLFRADRTPKEATKYVCSHPTTPESDLVQKGPEGKGQPVNTGTPHPAEVRPNSPLWYVYKDGNSVDNRFEPTGLMGDIGDLTLDVSSTQHPYSGKTALRITYVPRGKAPNECGYPAPCKWAGVRWQYPAGNFGQMMNGYDLKGYRWLRFAARSDSPVKVQFLVGGTPGAYPDSIILPIKQTVSLTSVWKEYVFDLKDADLSHVIGGFEITVNWPDNGIQTAGEQTYAINVDEVRFER